ncbi:MAG: CDP-alcohol phosphatidyltransferase family protein, partial [Phenylobacterium sp.]
MPTLSLTDKGAQAAKAPEGIAALSAGQAPEGLERLSPDELAYNSALRKREPPVLIRLTAENVREVEALTFAG